jgi:hypothetical protein
MSIAFFLGVERSYPPEFAEEAQNFVAAINVSLKSRGLPSFEDSVPVLDALGLGRSRVDHFGAGGLCAFASFAAKHECGSQFGVAGPRDVYLPIDFQPLLKVPFGKFLWFSRNAFVGSATRLLDSVVMLADPLGIPLEDGDLSDETAVRINKSEPLGHGDKNEDITLLEDLRPAWLLYHEGARLSIAHQCALVLAS